jgi:hypothetical protein
MLLQDEFPRFSLARAECAEKILSVLLQLLEIGSRRKALCGLAAGMRRHESLLSYIACVRSLRLKEGSVQLISGRGRP